MKLYKSQVIYFLISILISSQLWASILQTASSVNHSTPKTMIQSSESTRIQSFNINPYGELDDINTTKKSEARIMNFDQNPFVYGSGYYDTESNLQYMGARYYSADIGRFMAQDSYDLINRYNYANANPIMNIDPDGHMAAWVNYTLNSVGVFFGVLGALFTGGSSIGVATGLSGALSGLAGIGSEVLANNYTNQSKLLNAISFGAGIGSIVIDSIGAAAVFTKAWAPINLEGRGFALMDGEYSLKADEAYAYIIERGQHKGYGFVKTHSSGYGYESVQFDASNDSVEKMSAEIKYHKLEDGIGTLETYRGSSKNFPAFVKNEGVPIGTKMNIHEPSISDFEESISGTIHVKKITIKDAENAFSKVTGDYINGQSYNLLTRNCRQLAKKYALLL